LRSEFSVYLFDPSRYRLGSSSSGIGCSFGEIRPLKYRPYGLGDPAVPLALASAMRFFCNGLC
jgi:hypothetical protein